MQQSMIKTPTPASNMPFTRSSLPSEQIYARWLQGDADPVAAAGAEKNAQPPARLIDPDLISDFKVLVKTTRYYRVSDLPRGIQVSPSMEGLLINRITNLSFDEQRLIHESYPQAQLSAILIFEEGRKPSRPIQIFLLFGGGTLAIGLSLAAMWIARTEGESVVGETSGGWPDPFHFSAVALLGAGISMRSPACRSSGFCWRYGRGRSASA